MTLLTYGKTSTLDATQAALFAEDLTSNSNVPAGATSTTTLPLIASIDPNSQVQSMNGNIAAFDPVTGQDISVPANFVA